MPKFSHFSRRQFVAVAAPAAVLQTLPMFSKIAAAKAAPPRRQHDDPDPLPVIRWLMPPGNGVL